MRIQQLTRLILTSQTVDEARADEGESESRPGSPVKVDFDMSVYQVCFVFPCFSSRAFPPPCPLLVLLPFPGWWVVGRGSW